MFRSTARVCALLLCVILLTNSLARAESLFLSAPQLAFDINVTNVDVKYTITDKVNGIGKFSAVGTPQWFGSPSNTITSGTYRVDTFFDLGTGQVRTSDPGNLIDVTGTIGGTMKTFFHSTSLKLFGSGTQDTFDVVFRNNSGTVQPGSDIMTRIMGVSIPNFGDPSFLFTLAPTSKNGDMIFDNTTASGIEKGTANVWAPAPKAATGGLVLILGLAAHQAFRGWMNKRRSVA